MCDASPLSLIIDTDVPLRLPCLMCIAPLGIAMSAATDANANKSPRVREEIPVPSPRCWPNMPVSKQHIHKIGHSIRYSFCGRSRVEITRDDGRTEFPTRPGSDMQSIVLAPKERAAKSSKAATEEDRKRREQEMRKRYNQQRPNTKMERSQGSCTIGGIVVGHTVEDLVRNLHPFGPKKKLLVELARLARQADAALGTCKGDDVFMLNMGLLSMTKDCAQAQRESKLSAYIETRLQADHGVKYRHKTDGLSSNRVAGPTLAILFTCEWLLAAASASEPPGGAPTILELTNFLVQQPSCTIGGLRCAKTRIPSFSWYANDSEQIWKAELSKWCDAETRALQRVQYAALNAECYSQHTSRTEVERLKAMLRAAKLAAWPRDETLNAEQQPRLLKVVNDQVLGDETYIVHLELKGYTPPSPYDVYVQFQRHDGSPIGSPLYVESSAVRDDLNYQVDELFGFDRENPDHSQVVNRLRTFHVGECEVTGTLGDVVSWEQAIDDETPIPIVFTRDCAFERHVDAVWPVWERGGATPVDVPIEDVAPSAAVVAEDTATRALLAAKLIEMKSVEASVEHLKEAHCLHAGMLMLAESDSDGFEFNKTMLCPVGVKQMFATMLLKCVIDDLDRRKGNGATAPPVGKPQNRKADRNEQVVLCSTPEHRIVLADCLLDAFWAFTTATAEAKAARAVFKPAVPRPNRQQGNSSAADA